MSDEETTAKKRRILRFIRDLDLRYIRGSIDRRTYQTLKNKYQEILTSLPTSIKGETETVKMEETKATLPQVESDIQQMESGIQISEPPSVPKRTIELPVIELPDIPILEIEELKIRYVMHMAIKAATKTFEEEMGLEQDYVSGKIDDQEYMSSKNEIEAKQHKIFQHFYKLSELLFSVCKDHLFKNTHNNFLLFNNELSENINRLRRLETDKPELKGIIYEINDRVLRHRPILRKAAQDTLRWKVNIQQEKERFSLFYEVNKEKMTQSQNEMMNRYIKQLEIYEELLDDDINDYTRDLDAMDQIYGEHLRFQEIVTPYFKDLSVDIEDKIQRYSEMISFQQLKNRVFITSSTETKELDYMVMSELRSLWRYTGKPVLDEQNDLVGFLIGPAKMQEEYGILIKQQQEISLSMVRRLFDNIISPADEDIDSEEEKKQYLLRELLETLPQVPFNFLVPDSLIEYCRRKNIVLTNDLIDVLSQPDNFLFVALSAVSKTQREIRITSENIMLSGNLLPYYNPTESNNFASLLNEKKDVKLKNVFNKVLGKAHSTLYHPGKGYFLVTERENLSDDLFVSIYNYLYSNVEFETDDKVSIENKKHHVLSEFSKEFNIPINEVEEPENLKRILIEKNTGILPEIVDNSKYDLFSVGTLKIIGEHILVDYGAPVFNIADVFDLKGKIVENVKGTEIGVVYNMELEKKPHLNIWTSIDLLLIASFIDSEPETLFSKDKHFVDNLAISIGKLMSIAPQVALRPDTVMTFMNLIGKLSKLEDIKETIDKFKPKIIDLTRVITVEKQKILADISDKEIMDEITSDFEEGDVDEDKRFVTSPDYYLRDK